MRRIALTQNKVALVSDCDADLAVFNWYCSKGYAARNRPSPDRGVILFLHREIANRMGIKGLVDHRNRNKLDNRRQNLWPATHSQNHANAGCYRNNTSGFQGVTLRKDKGKWEAAIMVRGKRFHLGQWNTPEEAAREYNKAARKHFGKFAWLNRFRKP